eukprot:scaffold276112_cov27-Tisochrysis_lutea.AAC.1
MGLRQQLALQQAEDRVPQDCMVGANLGEGSLFGALLCVYRAQTGLQQAKDQMLGAPYFRSVCTMK